MAYTAYKFKPSFVEKRLKSYKSNLMKFKGHDNLVANAVRVIRERLEADPRRYLSYGPRASEILCPWDNRSPPNGCIQ